MLNLLQFENFYFSFSSIDDDLSKLTKLQSHSTQYVTEYEQYNAITQTMHWKRMANKALCSSRTVLYVGLSEITWRKKRFLDQKFYWILFIFYSILPKQTNFDFNFMLKLVSVRCNTAAILCRG